MVGNMMGTSWSMASSFVVGQHCDIVDLDGPTPRMPEADEQRSIAGKAIPLIALDAFHASTPIKVELALARLPPQ